MEMNGIWTPDSNPEMQYLYNGKEKVKGLWWYDYGARYYDPKISRFLSVDPAADEYPGISPFAYVANNPIKYIDPDGMRIKLAGPNKRVIRRALRSLSRNSMAAKNVIKDLRRSKFTHTIQLGSDTRVSNYDKRNIYSLVDGLAYDKNSNIIGKGGKQGATLTWNPNLTSQAGADAKMTLAHELNHLKDAQDGTYNPNRMLVGEGKSGDYRGYGLGSDKPGLNYNEFLAVQFENTVTAQWNQSTGEKQPLRDFYTKDNQDYNGLILDYDYLQGMPELPQIDEE